MPCLRHEWHLYTAQKMKFPIKDFFSRCGQILSILYIFKITFIDLEKEISLSRKYGSFYFRVNGYPKIAFGTTSKENKRVKVN